MSFDTSSVRSQLKSFQFKNLFTQDLGWDNHSQSLSIPINQHIFQLDAVAEKKGMVAFVCAPDNAGQIPDYAIRRKIEYQVSKTVREHIIIYTDANRQAQVWQWVRREKGKPVVAREVPFYASTSGDLLIQKLNAIKVELEEEPEFTLVTQTGRVSQAFNVENVTKRFYDRFKAEHARFLLAIEPKTLPDTDRIWYTSVMLNRLMFLYFVQRKGFLAGDENYLRNRLKVVQDQHGSDKFFTFYRHFLMRLFHEGLGNSAHSQEIKTLLGAVPYLNGGLFTEHAIERRCREQNIDIQIEDAAFERVFAFFDDFDWHLDNRPTKAGNEINPDVLGYIFEKYINYNEAGQKENGAYYTKEDITEYISRSTILPYLLDTAREDCRIAFRGEDSVWRLLKEDPDKYIFAAVRHGMEHELPPDIEAGIADVSKRGGWNKPAPSGKDEIALPTEIWREVVARRLRCEELRAKLASGAVESVNDLITYNLDIRQFVADIIAEHEGAELIQALWRAIKNVRILDPTVGSGAFLFAALNILEPLYEQCLERMETFVGDVDRAGVSGMETKHRAFREELAHVNAPQHPNRAYFIFKSIIVNNLFGVDIMEEATEICKLRLFLKLVAQVQPDASKPNMGVEPLPDVDFNIRAGNTLVGYVNEADRARLWTLAGFENLGERVENLKEMLSLYSEKLADFRKVQAGEKAAYNDSNEEMERAAELVREPLDRDLLKMYITAGKCSDKITLKQFRSKYAPIHWFLEFPHVMAAGGFDVIIGNPPYVEYSKVKKDYQLIGYSTEETANLYSIVSERATTIGNNQAKIGLIIQLSAFSTPRMEAMNRLANHNGTNFISFFECRPSKLFDGVDVRLAIWLRSSNISSRAIFATGLHRFPSEFRDFLFPTISYVSVSDVLGSHVTPKLTHEVAASVYRKLITQGSTIGEIRQEKAAHQAFYSYGIRYWARVLNTKPYYKSEMTDVSTGEKTLSFSDATLRDTIVCVMSSSLFFWYYCVVSDGHNFTKTVIDSFPVGKLNLETSQQLEKECVELMRALQASSFIKTASYKTTGHIEYREYRVGNAKPIIDEIDRVLAKHYGFTDEELDFIINYDIKYRMGRGGADEE